MEYVSMAAWKVGFYKDLDTGQRPARDWLDDLERNEPVKASAVAAAIARVLRPRGTDVCESEWGKNLGDGLYEFRVRRPASSIRREFPLPADDEAEADEADTGAKILLRVFFTTYGRQVLLLCSGYDKGRHPSEKRQQAEIKRARAMADKAQANLRARDASPKRH